MSVDKVKETRSSNNNKVVLTNPVKLPSNSVKKSNLNSSSNNRFNNSNNDQYYSHQPNAPKNRKFSWMKRFINNPISESTNSTNLNTQKNINNLNQNSKNNIRNNYVTTNSINSNANKKSKKPQKKNIDSSIEQNGPISKKPPSNNIVDTLGVDNDNNDNDTKRYQENFEVNIDSNEDYTNFKEDEENEINYITFEDYKDLTDTDDCENDGVDYESDNDGEDGSDRCSNNTTNDTVIAIVSNRDRNYSDNEYQNNFIDDNYDSKSFLQSLSDSEIKRIQQRDIQSIENEEIASFVSSSNTSLKNQQSHERQFYTRQATQDVTDTHTISSVKSIFSGAHGSIYLNNGASINSGGNNRIVFGNYLNYIPLPHSHNHNYTHHLQHSHHHHNNGNIGNIGSNYNNAVTNNTLNINYANSIDNNSNSINSVLNYANSTNNPGNMTNIEEASIFSDNILEDNVSTRPLVSLSSDEDTDMDTETNSNEEDVADINEEEAIIESYENFDDPDLTAHDHTQLISEDSSKEENNYDKDTSDDDNNIDSTSNINFWPNNETTNNYRYLHPTGIRSVNNDFNKSLISSRNLNDNTDAINEKFEEREEDDDEASSTGIQSKCQNSSRSTGLTSISAMTSPPLTTISSLGPSDTNDATAASILTLASSSRHLYSV